MTRPTTKSLLLGLVILALSASLAYLFVSHAELMIRVGMAEEQTAVFENMRQMAEESEGREVDYLDYALWYYQSGSKQIPGSLLDRMVERARQSSVREILSILKKRTGKDFGEDPQVWMEELKDRRAPKSVPEAGGP